MSSVPLPPSAEVTKAHASDRSTLVDALRGVACLWVLAFHLGEKGFWRSEYRGSHVASLVAKQFCNLVGLGYLGVPLFLVLSGFCLYYPIRRRMLTSAPGTYRTDWADFFRRRVLRIAPAYYVVMLLCLAAIYGLAGWPQMGENRPTTNLGYDILVHLLLIHNLDPRTMGTINGAFWTLGLEFQLYLLMPLLMAGLRRTNLYVFALATFLITFGWHRFADRAMERFPEIGLGWVHFVFWYSAIPLSGVFTFACGMIAAEVLANRGAPTGEPARVQQDRLLLGITAIVTLIVAASSLAHRIAPLQSAQYEAWSIVFALGLVVLWHPWRDWERADRPAFRYLARPIVEAGLFSYSIYLTHPMILHILSANLPSWHNNSAIALAVGVGLTVIAWIFYRLVEKPALSLLRTNRTSTTDRRIIAGTGVPDAPRTES